MPMSHVCLAGRLRSAPVFLLLLLAAGCTVRANGPLAMNDTTTLRILSLGDSYTIGQSVAEAERWPVQLADTLRRTGLAVAPPEIVARTGWTTSELADALDAAEPAMPFQLVTLLIGVNNQYRGLDTGSYRQEFRLLLARAIRYAGGSAPRVVVLSIPDWGVTPFAAGRDRAAIARAIDVFNAVNREETARAGARYVDITPVSRTAADNGMLLADDGLHPSGAMYAAWARLALPAALAAVGR